MPEIKKVVIKVDIHDNDDQRKVLKTVTTLTGIESLTVELKDQKLTLIGEMDPISVVNKLNRRFPSIRWMMGGAKNWNASIVSVEPVKDDKDDDGGGKKDKEDDKKDKGDDEHYRKWLEENKLWMYTNYHHVITPQYYVHEENPGGCFMW